ncbi:MAG: hypothetical protein ACXWW0_14270 [Bacteroidia bacterium]
MLSPKNALNHDFSDDMKTMITGKKQVTIRLLGFFDKHKVKLTIGALFLSLDKERCP